MALRWFRRSSQQAKSNTPKQQESSSQHPKASQIQETAAKTPLPADEQPSSEARDAIIMSEDVQGDKPRDRERSVLSNDDEEYLERVISRAEEPRLPPLDSSDFEPPSLAEAAAAEVAKKTPLPQSPPPPKSPASPSTKKANRFSWTSATEAFNRIPSLRRKSSTTKPATGLQPASNPPVQGPPTEEEAKRENKDLNNVLERLKIDRNSLQSRALSLSDDSRNLLNQFIQILKDIISGAPHAYDDLDKFMKNREKQIEGLYDSLPPFLQKLVQALPMKAWQYLGPQVAAGMATATSSDKTKAQADAKRQRQSTRYVPTLQSLLSNRGTVTALLRSILEFLETRFPMAMAGPEILLSVAVFLLLFVFWYCYKRGKEERLLVAEEESKRGRSRDGKSDEIDDEVRVDGANDQKEEGTVEPQRAETSA